MINGRCIGLPDNLPKQESTVLPERVLSMASAEPIFIRAIEAIYDEEVTEEDRENAVNVSNGETARISRDQMIPTIKVIAEDHHRYEALRIIYKNWEHAAGDEFDPKMPMLLIEMRELHLLWVSRQEHTCVMRACSFFESHLSDIVDVHPSTNFGSLIDAASSRDIITTDEQKLFHFVREVRNECGHNSWLDLGYPRELLIFACTTSNFLIGELADRRLAEMGVELTDFETEPRHFLRKLENDFQWTCTEEDGQIEWEHPESWTHPNREFSTYEDYWDSLE